VSYQGEALYLCNGVLYRPAVFQDEVVYEIVSSDEDVASTAEPSVSGPLRLNRPYMRGSVVREVQEALVAQGYDVGGVDGSFGPGTDRALRAFQADNSLTPDGVVDDETALRLGL
jgi:peptidoglycan hydrolase-like protein with peptidoglycan-binding domain